MDKLHKKIEEIRAKLENLRQHTLKETSTRTIIIDPLLESLGWDIRDPDEVQLEYPTVDGKSVDYALKINNKSVLLVEAKSLDDPLTDVKAITQVVGYAANDGIEWCILTNGVVWKVYRSVEKCPAPDKLMFEVTLDPLESEGISTEQVAKQMWRFSRDEMAKGTLDALGEQTFTDSKIEKALNALMSDAPRALLNLIKKTTNDENLRPRKIKESLKRILERNRSTEIVGTSNKIAGVSYVTPDTSKQRVARKKTKQRRESAYDESLHTSGKSQEVLSLYQDIDKACMSLETGNISKIVKKKYISYRSDKRLFCCVHIYKCGLRIWLKLKYARLDNPPPFARDVSNIGHWGTGDVELRVDNLSQIPKAISLIKQSFNSQY
jgi:predicted type IV restriction endonuclease